MSKKLHLTKEQVGAIQAYINQIRDGMGLGRWDVYVGAERAPKGARASVNPVEGRAVASIRLEKDWLDSTPEEMRNDIVHELIHLVHRDQTDLVRMVACEAIPKQSAYDVLWGAFRLATEVMVDHLASVIAPTMPLPDFARA